MKEYRNLIDLYYHNNHNLNSEKPFLYNRGYILSYSETERITNSLARVFSKHTNNNESVTVIISSDNILKSVCAISLIKINAMFVFLQTDEVNKFNAIREHFGISTIVCEDASTLPQDYLDSKAFLCQLRRENLKEYLSKNNGRPIKRRLTAAQRENLPFRIQFTSGSTGEPKLNVLQQFDIADCIQTYRNELIEKNGITQFGQYLTVDYSYGIESLLGSVFNGLPLYFFEERERKDLNILFDTIEQYKIDTVFFPASLINIIAKTPYLIKRFPSSLKIVFAGGERAYLTNEFIDELKVKRVRLVVSYGCSEMQQAMYHMIDSQATNTLSLDPVLGVPCHNCDILVIDQDGNALSKVGETGFLMIGRKGKRYDELHPLRRRNPHFISLPTNEKNVYYNTSDIVKISESGYVYCGRQEQRIKVRGYWVEPDLLRIKILDVPGIVSAYLTPYSDGFDNCRLALLYTGAVTEKEIVDYLNGKIQPHEIPAIIIRMESLPLTSTDKTDAKRCREIVSDYCQKHTATQNCCETEDLPQNKVREIFSRYSMDIRENPDREFSSLGIDSLILLVIICEIEQELSVRLDIENIDFSENNTLNKFISIVLQHLQ